MKIVSHFINYNFPEIFSFIFNLNGQILNNIEICLNYNCAFGNSIYEYFNDEL